MLAVLVLQADAQGAAAQDDNPYLPDPDLSPDELVQFMLAMQEKPKSIRERPGFAEAVIAAADRVLATQTTDANRAVAAETALATLHEKACLGDEKADQRLMEFVELLQEDKAEAIARQVTFFQKERQAIEAHKLSREEIPAAVDALREYLAGQTLTPRHLRFASSLVKAINQLDDESDPEKRHEYGELREKYFDQLATLLAKSDDKQVVAYGKKLAQSSQESTVDLVGKPLALEGVTALGTEFQWSAYRGKVVLVDFWATWCGPCRRQMPQLKEFYEKHKAAGFEIVGINLDRDNAALAKYLDENQIVWEHLVGDEPKSIAKELGVRAIPTLVLVDRDGTVIATSHKAEEMLPQATRLLEGAATTVEVE
jgi:thiol-disulfide isomerase/thioredoxin